MPAESAEHDAQGSAVVPFALPPGRDALWLRDPARFAASQQQAFVDMNLHVGK